MIKPPSNQKTYDAFYSGDSAIIQLPDGASDEQRKERNERLERALQSAVWADVLAGTDAPTIFTFKQLTAAQHGHLQDLYRAPSKEFETLMLAFCLALVDVKNMPESAKPSHVDTELGKMATTRFLDEAGCTGELGSSIIKELGAYVIQRARAADPL